MALFEDLTLGSVTSSALIGLGLVLAAPVLLPVVGAVVRPVVRLALHTGALTTPMCRSNGVSLPHRETRRRLLEP